MSGEQFAIDTHPARLAVLKVLTAADTTESTVGTMVGTFFGRHPQVADGTVVLTELNGAMDACIGFGGLFGIAFATDDFLDGESIHVVMGGGSLVEGHGEGGASWLFAGFSFPCIVGIVIVSSFHGAKAIGME